FGNEITGPMRWPVAISATLIGIALWSWIFHVLMRADVRKLFAGRRLNRPWIEWAAFIGTFVLFVGIHWLVRKTNASFTSIALLIGAIILAIWMKLALTQKPRTPHGTEILNTPRLSRKAIIGAI